MNRLGIRLALCVVDVKTDELLNEWQKELYRLYTGF